MSSIDPNSNSGEIQPTGESTKSSENQGDKLENLSIFQETQARLSALETIKSVVENEMKGGAGKIEGFANETAKFRDAAAKPFNELTYADHLKNAQEAVKYLENKIEGIRERGPTKSLGETVTQMIQLDQMLDHLQDGVEQLQQNPSSAHDAVSFLQKFGI